MPAELQWLEVPYGWEAYEPDGSLDLRPLAPVFASIRHTKDGGDCLMWVAVGRPFSCNSVEDAKSVVQQMWEKTMASRVENSLRSPIDKLADFVDSNYSERGNIGDI